MGASAKATAAAAAISATRTRSAPTMTFTRSKRSPRIDVNGAAIPGTSIVTSTSTPSAAAPPDSKASTQSAIEYPQPPISEPTKASWSRRKPGLPKLRPNARAESASLAVREVILGQVGAGQDPPLRLPREPYCDLRWPSISGSSPASGPSFSLRASRALGSAFSASGAGSFARLAWPSISAPRRASGPSFSLRPSRALGSAFSASGAGSFARLAWPSISGSSPASGSSFSRLGASGLRVGVLRVRAGLVRPSIWHVALDLLRRLDFPLTLVRHLRLLSLGDRLLRSVEPRLPGAANAPPTAGQRRSTHGRACRARAHRQSAPISPRQVGEHRARHPATPGKRRGPGSSRRAAACARPRRRSANRQLEGHPEIEHGTIGRVERAEGRNGVLATR